MLQYEGKVKEKRIKPKAALVALAVGEFIILPRPQYTSLRNTLSALRIEHPDREYTYNLIENGIEVICLK